MVDEVLDIDELKDWIETRGCDDVAVQATLEGFANYLCGGKAEAKYKGTCGTKEKAKPRELTSCDGLYYEAMNDYKCLKEFLRKERDLPENANNKYKYNKIISGINQDIECIRKAALVCVRPATCLEEFVEPDYSYFSYENVEHVRIALMLDRGRVRENSSLRYILMDIDNKINSIQLNETERTVYTLFKEGYGYSQAEIARLLKQKRQNVGHILRRIAEKIVQHEKR